MSDLTVPRGRGVALPSNVRVALAAIQTAAAAALLLTGGPFGAAFTAIAVLNAMVLGIEIGRRH